MAQRNLTAAADAAERHPRAAGRLGVDEEETAGWRDAARDMLIPYDSALEVHAQAEEFTQHQVWDFEATSSEQYPLLLHFPYFDLYRKQVVKQADLVLAMHLCGDAFTAEEKARNFAYYEGLTVRDSSLSACTQAVMAAEVGHLELAYDYFGEAALMDLDDLEHNTRDGIHIASLAGTWIAAVGGFGGMRDHDGELSFAPRLPENADTAGLPPRLPRTAPDGRGHPATGALPAAGGFGPGDPPPRSERAPDTQGAGAAGDLRARARGAAAAARARAGSPASLALAARARRAVLRVYRENRCRQSG